MRIDSFPVRASTIALLLVALAMPAGAQDAPPDMQQMILDSMREQPTMYLVALPPDAAVGNTWTISMGGMDRSYAIVAGDGDTVIVESVMNLAGISLVEAWRVDRTVDMTAEPEAGEAFPCNVVEAWIGVAGGEPIGRPVMEVPQMPAGGGVEIDHETGEEAIEQGGREWEATFIATNGARTWMATGTQFILRSAVAGEVVMQLTAWSDDGAEPAMQWPENGEEEDADPDGDDAG